MFGYFGYVLLTICDQLGRNERHTNLIEQTAKSLQPQQVAMLPLYPATWIGEIYRKRWLVELDIRSMKCSLGLVCFARKPHRWFEQSCGNVCLHTI
jgi:hypothetical protein